MQKHILLTLLVLTLGLFLGACCDPKPSNSMPMVIDSTFKDTTVKDVYDRLTPGADPTDSGFYPIYSIDVKNTGTDADTFKLTYERNRNGFVIPIVVQQYMLPGETKTFRTVGPIADHGVPETSDITYYSFFVRTPDSTSIHVENPTVKIHYGKTQNDAESCGSAGEDLNVDFSRWKK